MPKLDVLVSVGFCLGYGDTDYSISGRVGGLSREQFSELKAGMCNAIWQMQEMWMREQQRTNPEMKCAIAKSTPLPTVERSEKEG